MSPRDALPEGGLHAAGRHDTLVVDARDAAELVRRHGLSNAMAEIAQRIAALFGRWEDFDKSPRAACHSPLGVIELMPVADAQDYAFKYVNGHPGNTRALLPTVMAFGVLSDVNTGTPRLLSELTLVTALRTAAMSALAASHLARPDSRVMALIGNGAQSEFQALAFRDLVGVRELRLFDTDAQATAKLVRNLQGSGLVLHRCRDARQAVQGADIITTVTADKALATIITPDMVGQGQHFNAVGGDCPGKTELHPDVLRAARVFVEFEPQTRIEGDLQQMPKDFAVTEFWRVLRGLSPGRCSRQEITVFDSVGFALEDMAALTWVRDAALDLGIGHFRPLVQTAPDPKNLYAVIQSSEPSHKLVKAAPLDHLAQPV